MVVMQTTPRIGFWLDNSNQTPQQTAENILNANTGHGLYDLTLDKYVLITHDNVSEFVGHSFA